MREILQVAEQNMAIQRSSAPVAMSDPLPPHELQQVRSADPNGSFPTKTLKSVIFLLPPEGPARHLDVSRQKLSPHCLETVLDSQLPSPKLSPKMSPKISRAHKRGFFSLFQNCPAVRVIARHLRGKTCLAAIIVPRHQDVPSGPLGTFHFLYRFPASFAFKNKHFRALSVAFCYVCIEFSPRILRQLPCLSCVAPR